MYEEQTTATDYIIYKDDIMYICGADVHRLIEIHDGQYDMCDIIYCIYIRHAVYDDDTRRWRRAAIDFR